MKSILAIATLALVALVLEDKARQLAGDAQNAYGGAVDEARESLRSLEQNSGGSTCCSGANSGRNRLCPVETASALVNAVGAKKTHDINATSVIAFPALQGIFSDRFSVPRFALKAGPLRPYIPSAWMAGGW